MQTILSAFYPLLGWNLFFQKGEFVSWPLLKEKINRNRTILFFLPTVFTAAEIPCLLRRNFAVHKRSVGEFFIYHLLHKTYQLCIDSTIFTKHSLVHGGRLTTLFSGIVFKTLPT